MTQSAITALDTGDVDLARRMWAGVNGEALLGAWDAQTLEMKGITPEAPADPVPPVVPMRLTRAVSTQVFERDGYRCRYCAISVFTQWKNGHIPRLVAAMPDLTPGIEVRDGSLSGGGRSGALRNVDQGKWLWLVASADHVLPASHNGPTTLDNLVTACAGCNYGKMDWTLEQLEVVDPRVPAGRATPPIES